MKGRGFAPALAVGCALFAALVALGATTSARALTPLEQTQTLYDSVSAAQGDLQALRDQANALQTAIAGTQSDLSSARAGEKDLNAQLAQAQLLAADAAMEGPGIVVTLNDAPKERIAQAGAFYDINWFLVHDHDLLTVVNLLKDAGAEAVSINGVRLQADTAIHCAGPAIYVHDISLTPPFIIHAIGDSETLSNAILHGDDGSPAAIYQELQLFGIVFTVEKQEDIMIPASTTTDAARRASHDR